MLAAKTEPLPFLPRLRTKLPKEACDFARLRSVIAATLAASRRRKAAGAEFEAQLQESGAVQAASFSHDLASQNPREYDLARCRALAALELASPARGVSPAPSRRQPDPLSSASRPSAWEVP